ncbi:ATP-binding cassette domain-containing protein [Gordonia sp. ABSL1-1]|uniref:ATP-binding cassette domain-containing protein n=1 Tax=Gordonia sp. ABSL1-1 TaxID=3053923 RepID=UPI002573F1D8|nr:ATP-binding cassette domain-containing protein [Gordonia sp. ABSL1-1]MDL9935707.1 ATP-binding cassette domain-containing protein [Gordonia sp. ABSL1-1]
MVTLPETAVYAESLRKSFRGVHAVADVSFAIPTGTVCGMLGANGAGKTTTVRMLATLIRPDGGRAEIFGRDVVSQATAIRSLISLTGQYASLDEDLTAIENLELFGRLRGLNGRGARTRAGELVDRFGLAAAADRPITGFSGGMRRRIDLAASLITPPALLFLDEPTTGLDPTTRAQVWACVRDLVDEGTTVLLTTQYLDEADQLADSLVVVDAGRVIAEGTVDVLKDRVGARSLEVSVADPTRLDDAVAIVRARLGTEVVPSPEAARLSATLTDPGLSARIVTDLEAAGVVVAELAVRRPTLDEVFFAMTRQEPA